MARVLLTAFEPFGGFAENSSRLCLRAVEQNPPLGVELVTRLYPVDFDIVRGRLFEDLSAGYTAALHLGQAGRKPHIELEAFAINAGGYPGEDAADFRVLEPAGPAAYRCPLPLPHWAARLRAEGFPVEVSFHAGTYLCNATSYWSQHWAATSGQPLRSLFVHLPLAEQQGDTAGHVLPLALMSEAIRRIVILMAGEPTALA